ncbi:hypothetical protein BZG35_12235 [Brevundimonas sp. LM2]|uniref:hypothetical protein n=1 Tax=Brevundimonas sp. LM2 TaxID=1938605 RepID=UPI000983A651|nr:hypothetical protein [Brevundimonas sp. LM2]AQR62327.1 hypothetical protein BZG35_12235 [Brevundimonas sp. LM2]
MTKPLTLTLDDALLTRVEAAAALAGLSAEAWATMRVTDALVAHGMHEDAAVFDADARVDGWVDDRTAEARAFQHAASLAALEEYDRTGISFPFEEWATEFRADVEARLAKRWVC